MKFLFSERYRLELHWSKVLRPEAGIMWLTGAYFSGPVLANAEKINDKDSIKLDFCSQLVILVKNVYVATLSWDKVAYNNNGTVSLKGAKLTYDPELKGIPNLANDDYLIIDTKNHENEKHLYNLLYPTYVLDRDSELYNYRR